MTTPMWIDKSMTGLTYVLGAAKPTQAVAPAQGEARHLQEENTVEITKTDPNPNMARRLVLGESMAWLLFGDQEYRLTAAGMIIAGRYQVDGGGNIIGATFTLDIGQAEPIRFSVNQETKFYCFRSQDPTDKYTMDLALFVSNVQIGDSPTIYFAEHQLPRSGDTAYVTGVVLQ